MRNQKFISSLFFILFLWLISYHLASAETLTPNNAPQLEKVIFNTLELDLNNAKLSLTQVEQNIQNAKQNLRSYQEQLQELSFTPQDPLFNLKESTLKARIANQKNLITLNEQRRNTLNNSIDILNQKLLNAQNTYQYNKTFSQKQRRLSEERSLTNNIQILSQQQKQWLNQISYLNQELTKIGDDNTSTVYQNILQKIFSAEEKSNITQLSINMLYTQNNLQNIINNISDDSSASDLNEQRHALLDITDQLQQYRSFVKDKLHLLQQKKDLATAHAKFNAGAILFSNTLDNIMSDYQAKLQTLDGLINQAATVQAKTTTLLAKALARRQGLPGLSTQGWVSLGQGLTQLMVVSYQVGIGSAHDFYHNILDFSVEKKIRLFGIAVLISAFFVCVRFFCQYFMQRLQQRKDAMLKPFLYGLLRLVKMHLWFICLFVFGLCLLDMAEASEQITRIALHLGYAVLLYSLAVNSARIVLYENIADHSGNDVQLFWRLCWIFTVGLILGILVILSQELSVLYEVQDFFNRLFALFVLITALMLLKAWRVVPKLFTPSINPKREYLIRAINLLGLLIPLIILSNAVIGLIGYVELAWTISKYEGLFLLVAATYLIIKGLLNDVMEQLAHSIIRLRNGWIFTEAILKPLSMWLQLLLFLSAIYSVLVLYDLNTQPIFIDYFYKILHFPLLRFSNSVITFWIVIKAFVTSWIFIWATRWSREFCYRRVFHSIRDIGGRNSLAIFAQYGVALLGILIVLKILQIDLTTITVVIGGLAVGVGFGLRDLANNFMSGLLLLIERPVRRGDTVTIGEYEGKVVDIGMRAITILSSDNREVLVPNSEAFTKTFINWTKQNDVVRCETTIKVRWQDDPHQLGLEIVQTIINTIDVLPHPAPDVLLKSMNDGLLEFEIRFYIHYNVYESKTIMKSKVLFNIWDRFAELGIAPAYPTQKILLKNDHDATATI